MLSLKQKATSEYLPVVELKLPRVAPVFLPSFSWKTWNNETSGMKL